MDTEKRFSTSSTEEEGQKGSITYLVPEIVSALGDTKLLDRATFVGSTSDFEVFALGLRRLSYVMRIGVVQKKTNKIFTTVARSTFNSNENDFEKVARKSVFDALDFFKDIETTDIIRGAEIGDYATGSLLEVIERYYEEDPEASSIILSTMDDVIGHQCEITFALQTIIIKLGKNQEHPDADGGELPLTTGKCTNINFLGPLK